MNADGAFVHRLEDTFREEARERLRDLDGALLALEDPAEAAGGAARWEVAYRAAHSLKGAARAVGWTPVESLCQAMEGLIAGLRAARRAPAAGEIDLLREASDRVAELVGQAVRVEPAWMHGLLERLARAPAPTSPADPAPSAPPVRVPAEPPPAPVPAAGAMGAGLVRVTEAEMERLLREADELAVVRHAAERSTTALQSLLDLVERWRGEATADRMRELRARLREASDRAARDHEAVEERVGRFLDGLRAAFLVPFSTLFEAVPRMVRDIAREKGIRVGLSLDGGDVRADKRILDALRDPLVHLLRNALDHGIEDPASRVSAGKPAAGRLSVSARQRGGGMVELSVSDDGRGVDVAAVKRAAVARGVIDASSAGLLDDAAALDLVFHGDVSTRETATRLSGRGLGLAIVRDGLRKIAGQVSLETAPGAGTTFRFLVPVSRTAFRGVLVRLGGRLAVVPSTEVLRVEGFRADAVTDGPLGSTVRLAGGTLPLLVTAGADAVTGDDRALRQALVIARGAGSAALLVDEVLGEQEIIARPAAPQLARLRGVAGATVLATGELVPILRAGEIGVPPVPRRDVPAPSPRDAPAARVAARPRSLLVVEDSITSRMLLKNILEAAGYAVRTAVDGREALAALAAGGIDLVVSDIDMPVMNGLALTGAVRADPALRHLPVVLLTALDRAEDRERGLAAGASAYLVKSGFDQENLLAALERLL